ncbi:MAG: D-alanyl-D-alanine carboxypeptidase family protein, partial [Pseudomonadota bacterium]
TGSVVASQEPDKQVAPASLTKLMSAYVIFSYLKADQFTLDDTVTVSSKAYRTPGSRMFIEQNAKVRVGDLIQGMIVQSGNDASVALAEFVAGTEAAFAELMNNFAAKLGMSGSHFQNATGLPGDNHVSTARDMATLARAIIAEFPEFYAWYSQREYTYAGIRQQNRNRLLWRDSTVDGMKTGHTDAAGYCLVSSAKRNDMRLIAALMGARSGKARIDASQALLNYGFRFYETRQLYAGGEPIRRVRAWKGASEELALGTAGDVYVTVPRGRFDELEARVELPSTIFAPVTVGDPLGELVVSHGDERLAKTALIALNEVAEGSLWQRLTDEVSLWFE